MGIRETIERLRRYIVTSRKMPGGVDLVVKREEVEQLVALAELAIEARKMMEDESAYAAADHRGEPYEWVTRFDALTGAEGRGT